VVSRERESVVDQRYEANRKGYFAQTVWRGAFAMKPSMQRTTDEALRSLFEQFLGDVVASSAGWLIEVLDGPVEPVEN
jgi:hypothetical protein